MKCPKALPSKPQTLRNILTSSIRHTNERLNIQATAKHKEHRSIPPGRSLKEQRPLDLGGCQNYGPFFGP